MKTTKNLVNLMLMSIAAAATVVFTSCSDDLNEIGNGNNSQQPEGAQTALLEAYGLTFENFITEGDVTILDADTTQISVSKAYAEKMGIESFVGHPMGIWHKVEQLPYIRKATAEKLVGDRYILTVVPATVAEIIGDKKVTLNTGIYVNPDADGGSATRADGSAMPAYAAKYMDENDVLHPAVIHMTDPYDYEKGYHTDDDQPIAQTRADGSYQYITADELAAEGTRASAHRRILAFNSNLEMDKNFDCTGNGDSINVRASLPIDFELNYFITLDGGVKWHFIIPEPYVEKFEAGVDGKFAFTPEFKIGFKKEWKLDEDKWKKTLIDFSSYSFTFWVGPVPVVIKCDPGLYIKLDGKVSGAVSVGFKYEYENNFKAGVRYTDGNGWEGIKEFNEVKNDFTFIKPEVEVHGEAGVGLYFGVDVMIYGVAGPEVSVGPRIGGEFNVAVKPFEEEMFDFDAEVKVTVNAVAGAKLKVLGYELAEWSHTFPLFGPWTIWKYPSDGTEHKSPAAKKAEEGKNFVKKTCQHFSDKNLSATFFELQDMLAQMNGKTNEEMENELTDEIMKYFGGNAPAGDKELSGMNYVCDWINKLKAETEPKYKKWCIDQNWQLICKLVMENEHAKIIEKEAQDECFLINKALRIARQRFIDEFGREPSQSPEDLQYIANIALNFRDILYDEVVAIVKQDPSIAQKMQTNPQLIEKAIENIREKFKMKFGYKKTSADSDCVYFVRNFIRVITHC